MITPEASENLETYISNREGWIADAVEVVTGDRTLDPRTVFKEPIRNPQDVRGAEEPLDLTFEQETKLREVAGRFGLGGEIDLPSTAEHQILEGGKPWKVESEARVTANARTVIFAGSPIRKIGEDESSYLARKFGGDFADISEYDMVRKVAEGQAGFQALGQEEVLPFGYEVSVEHEFKGEPTGQLVKIGEAGGKEILVLRVDGELYEEDGKTKQRFRPDSADLMVFVSQALSAAGDELSAVSLNTSSTYPARAIDSLRAGLKERGRRFDVGMYGRQTEAQVKGLPAPVQSEIQNFPGELNRIWDKLQSLKEELSSQTEQ